MHLKIEKTITLLEALEILFPDSSRATIRSIAKEGRVFVDELVQKDLSLTLTASQTIHIGAKTEKKKSDLDIIYEDEHLISINKPSGILSVKSNSERFKTIEALLNERYKRVFPVHRLDQDTSGVMIFALTPSIEKLFNQMFEKHALNRVYIGIIEGSLNPPSGTWISYLYEDKNFFVHSSQDPSRGMRAVTHYKTLKQIKRYSLVEFTLETGRKNQIRVHTKEHLAPLAGDKKYGAATDPIKRLCLHAKLLEFTHPITLKPMKFEVPIPKEFEKIFTS